jgi:hypothetical protein
VATDIEKKRVERPLISVKMVGEIFAAGGVFRVTASKRFNDPDSAWTSA